MERTLPAMRTWRLPALPWFARMLAVAIAVGIGAAMIWANAISWGLEDWRTYLAAADRVAHGGPVYDWTGGAEYVYRYAPWFAYALTPFLLLPHEWADGLWSALVIAATLGAVAPLMRSYAGVALGVLMAGLLMRVASTGNVQPILIAALVLGLHTRYGPVIVALAASLKATPILFVAVFVAERRWKAAGATLALTTLLVAPMLWLGYETAAGPSESLLGVSPLLWAGTIALVIGAIAWLAWRRSPYTALAAGVAAYLALPRSFMYDVSLILPGAGVSSPAESTRTPASLP